MGDISEHFSRWEFSCNCGCGFNTVDVELITVFEKMRQYFDDNHIIINSGCRCPKHNEEEGGKPNSEHLKGRAADFVIEGIKPENVYRYLDEKYPANLGLGKYDSFTHADTRSGMGRW